MGRYRSSLLESPYNGRMVYNNWDTDYYLYFSNGWLVSDVVGDTSGYIYNTQQVSCPFYATNIWWYALDGSWHEDQTLNVRCIE